ncbi:MAG: 3-phosphoshikimate 1-carboxyvinyltransferase [Gemmatimonadota bacterium]
MLMIAPPGDKSLSHRALILSSLAHGSSRLRGLLPSSDVKATARVLRALGAELPESLRNEVSVEGPTVFHDAAEVLDCGNSGTTARLVLGLLAGMGVAATLTGDESLRGRPMDRVVYPLQAMGARIRYLDRPGRLPVRVERRASGALRSLRHRPRVASAQVKSALLLAGLGARVRTEIWEPGRSRDHTERMLSGMGAPVSSVEEEGGTRIVLDADGWEGELSPLDWAVPGDPSSAAFLVSAALLGGLAIRVRGMSVNPTRMGFYEVVREMGAEVRVESVQETLGEPVGEITVSPGALRGFAIDPGRVPGLLDEIPVLAVLAARAKGRSRIRGAKELRVKESDRLELLASNLRALGVRIREFEDGLEIEGTAEPLTGTVRTGGDHRIAMAFGALGSAPSCRIAVDDPGCVDVSFPDFWPELRRMAK